MSEEILSPDNKLKLVKLEYYFDLLFELGKYRRISVYRNQGYPKTNWITALTIFYDVMFNEAQEDEYKKKYKKTFTKIETMNHTSKIYYEELLILTRQMMLFAKDTGITKLSKHEEKDAPGGANYE